MSKPTVREVDALAASTPTWRRLSALLVQTLAPFRDAAHAVAAKLRADRAGPFVALAKGIEAHVSAPSTSKTLPDLARCKTFEQRSLACADLMMAGEWKLATATELAKTWKVDRAAIGNYRRTAQVVRASLDFDFDEKLSDTLAHLLRMQETNETQAGALEKLGDPANAARYRAIALNARTRYAEISGLVQHRFSISLEADPRMAGLFAALHHSLADLDRLREAYVAEVVQLTGGPVPKAPFPIPSAHVRDAVRRYEAEIGARQLPR